MSATALQLADAARIIREATKDRSYRSTPLGLEVARYYRWKKNEWGATADTMRDYESILAKLALDHADLRLSDFNPPVGTERLRECWDDRWGDKAARTRSKVRSVWVDFFDWAVRERGMHGNPARALAAPKKRDVEIKTFQPSFVDRVITAQTYPADAVGTALILKYAARRGAIANAQKRHFDFDRRLLTLFTKGGRVYPIPVVEDWIWLKLGELELDAQWLPDDYLIYHQDTRRRRVPVEEAEETLNLGNGTVAGYARLTTRTHHRKPTVKLVHFWWYRCLVNAGVIPKGTTAGLNMHRGRHTAATELQRSRHDLRLTQSFLGHADIGSTSRYTQMDTVDLASALLALFEEEDPAT